MKTNYLSVLLGAFVLLCGAAIWYQSSSPKTLPSSSELKKERNTTSQKKAKLVENRELVLGEATETKSSIPNEPSALFNDPAIKQAWGLKKSDAARAWSVTKGNKKVIVAVIDTGIDINHEDLKSNLWKNPGESGLDNKGRDKSTNGIDDDGNGFVDDVYGWNFVSNNNKLDDNHGHGTHIAGIIGAEAGNKKGISGISPEVSVMVLKYYDPKVPNTDNLKNTISAIHYAIKMGAHIINYSGGGTEYSKEEFEAVKEADQKGILFVAAAGNEHSDSDQFHYYPANYKLNNIISVTAVDPTTEVLSSSNHGVETVDIAAPGQSILSCLPGNSYGLMTGTSQATAFVTGAAVLVMSHKDLYKQPNEVKKFILATGDSSQSLLAKTKTSRQLNLFKSLTILEKSTAVSGIKSNSVKDSSLFSIKQVGNIDPNVKKEVDQISGFGQDLLKAIGQKPMKRNFPKNNDRLGTQTSDPNEN